MTWAIYDAPPFMMTAGDDRDQGIFDRIRRLLGAQLGGGDRTVTAPFPRIHAALRSGADWCFVGGIRNAEREAFAVFSLPVAMFTPLRIVVRSDRRDEFARLGPLSLRRLLAERPDLRTSLLRARTMAPAIDALLEAHPAVQTHSEFEEAFRMLLAGRLDYLVEFGGIAADGARRLGREGDLVGLPFAEAPEPILARVMCAGTEWGRARIARIDAILVRDRPGPAYRAIVEAWSEDADRGTIRNAYESTFLTAR
ncbi:transporter substrate-binding domain-containing protein [uncultured Methylobacterium sp.]|uniref:transporter substrate-binding domain-containing protein n=1 Tax=uncultured Methylobacterium sp. TaxID=157278 RepID=UPI002623C729|nr:transporter substrate-binding domain-containing protein [uncultured Methylobacterium sp.]